MFKSFTVKNFRCFRDLTLAPLERVNLIAGMNNVGKTALLEALFIHASPNNPSLPLRINLIRGVDEGDVKIADVWKGLFFDGQSNQAIETTSLNDDQMQRTLEIHLSETEDAQLDPSGSLVTFAPELTLKYHDTSGLTGISRASITSAGIKYTRAKLSSALPGTLLSTHRRVPVEESFSQLEADGRQEELLNVLRQLEPRLRRLTVLVMGNKPVIYGDLGMNKLLPLFLMGEGMTRLVSSLLRILTIPRGMVLIDEVENGFHYSAMGNVWKAIIDAARRSETQVFATTHSWECIRAAHRAFEESGIYDFRLHRLERVKDDIRAVTYDQETLATSVEMNLEVR